MTCDPGRRAYMKHRALMRERGVWEPRTDAGPVRAHVQRLREHGLGLAVIAKLSGVTVRSLAFLMYGEPAAGKRPAVTMSTVSARRVLEFWPTLEQMPDMVSVDATGTRRRLQALATVGWSMRALALRCGKLADEFARVLGRERVFAATARLVRDLYDELWDQAPPETCKGERISARKARAGAVRGGWAPPMAWDDDSIDNPDAAPNLGGHTLRDQALFEDSEELVNGQGYTVERAAERLGVRPGYLRKVRSEARWHPAEVAS